jgi:hypothetical protein
MPKRPVVLLALVMIVLSVGPTSGQDLAGGPPPTRAFRVTSLLSKPAVRRELGLENLQIEALVQIDVEIRHLHSSPLGRLNQETLEERQAAHEEFKRQYIELERKAVAILLPAQRERFEQLLVQSIIRVTDANAGLTHPAMVERLGLSEAQLEEIAMKGSAAQEKLKEKMRELMAEIAKAKEQARSEVLAALTGAQRKQYLELTGNLYDATQR